MSVVSLGGGGCRGGEGGAVEQTRDHQVTQYCVVGVRNNMAQLFPTGGGEGSGGYLHMTGDNVWTLLHIRHYQWEFSVYSILTFLPSVHVGKLSLYHHTNTEFADCRVLEIRYIANIHLQLPFSPL